MNKNNNSITTTPNPMTTTTTTTTITKIVTMMLMMMLMILTKMIIIIVFLLMKDIVVANCLSILSLHIMLDVAKVHGLHTQNMIRIYPSKRGDSVDHACINQKSHKQKYKCNLPIEHFWSVDCPQK